MSARACVRWQLRWDGRGGCGGGLLEPVVVTPGSAPECVRHLAERLAGVPREACAERGIRRRPLPSSLPPAAPLIAPSAAHRHRMRTRSRRAPDRIVPPRDRAASEARVGDARRHLGSPPRSHRASRRGVSSHTHTLPVGGARGGGDGAIFGGITLGAGSLLDSPSAIPPNEGGRSKIEAALMGSTPHFQSLAIPARRASYDGVAGSPEPDAEEGRGSLPQHASSLQHSMIRRTSYSTLMGSMLEVSEQRGGAGSEGDAHTVYSRDNAPQNLTTPLLLGGSGGGGSYHDGAEESAYHFSVTDLVPASSSAPSPPSLQRRVDFAIYLSLVVNVVLLGAKGAIVSPSHRARAVLPPSIPPRA